MVGSIYDWNFAAAETCDDGAFEGAAFLEGLKNGELFPLEAAEVNGVVHSVYSEIDGFGFEARNGGHFFALLALFHGIAGDVGGRVLFDGEEKIVDGILEIKKTNVRLELKTQFCGIGAG